jgi:hypothetical protein
LVSYRSSRFAHIRRICGGVATSRPLPSSQRNLYRSVLLLD